MHFRDGCNVILPSELVELAEIKREAQFYLLEGLEKFIDKKMGSSHNRIHLNIGGVHYDANYDTLTSVPGSRLETNSVRWYENKQQEVYFDRDGKHFGYILNYLRDGLDVVLPSELVVLKELKWEAKFYLLQGLDKLIDKRIGTPYNSIHLNIGGMRYDTNYETLNRVPDSTLANSMRWNENTQREVYIDRDGKHFRYILNFLRDGTNGILPKNIGALEELQREAQFYMLTELVQLVKQKMETESFEKIVLSPNYIDVSIHAGDSYVMKGQSNRVEMFCDFKCPCNSSETKLTRDNYSFRNNKHFINGTNIATVRVVKEYLRCFDIEIVGVLPVARYHVWKSFAHEYEFKVVKKQKGIFFD